jgi:hypothetical protein
MADIGYNCCASTESLKEVLHPFIYENNKLTERDVALIVGMMANYHTSSRTALQQPSSLPFLSCFGAPSYNDDDEDERELQSWNVAVFVEVMRELVCGI